MFTILDLQRSRIGDNEMQHLTNALQDNKVVNSNFSSTCPFFQTIITLNLAYNEIGDNGVQYLATIIRNNTVCRNNDLYCLYSP
jgi:hypothetical protein